MTTNQHERALTRGPLTYIDADGKVQQVTAETPLPIVTAAMVTVAQE